MRILSQGGLTGLSRYFYPDVDVQSAVESAGDYIQSNLE